MVLSAVNPACTLRCREMDIGPFRNLYVFVVWVSFKICRCKLPTKSLIWAWLFFSQVYLYRNLYFWITYKNTCKGLLFRRFHISTGSMELVGFHSHHFCVSILIHLPSRKSKSLVGAYTVFLLGGFLWQIKHFS